jgi:hypothetical protein
MASVQDIRPSELIDGDAGMQLSSDRAVALRVF